MKRVLLLVCLSIFLSACNAGNPTPSPPPPATPAPSATAMPPTPALPTATLPPTATASPTASAPTQPAGAQQLQVIAHVVGNARSVAVAGAYAYVAGNAGTLRILDVSDPAHPTSVGRQALDGLAAGIAVANRTAYVADSQRSGLHVVDVSDPTAPAETSFLSTPGPAFDVAVAGPRAYLAEGYASTAGELTGGGLRIVDVSDPAAPTELGFYDTPGQALSVAVAEPYAYVGDAEAGLRVIDVSEPAAPTEIGVYQPRGPVSAIDVDGRWVYLVDGVGGSLRSVDAEDLAAPTEAGFYYTYGLAQDVAIVNDHAFVVDSGGELHVLDVSDPATPAEAGFAEVAGNVTDVAVASDHAYVAAGDEGLFILRTAILEPAPTPVPPTPAPLADAPPADLHRPADAFAESWATDEGLRRDLGWAEQTEPAGVEAAFQPFEGGVMIWRGDQRVIYALFRGGSWRAFEDTWTNDQPEFDPNILAPKERFQPIRGFGKVWREHRDVRGRLGWALQPEYGLTAPIQAFEHGVLIDVDGTTYALVGVAGQPLAWYQRSPE